MPSDGLKIAIIKEKAQIMKRLIERKEDFNLEINILDRKRVIAFKIKKKLNIAIAYIPHNISAKNKKIKNNLAVTAEKKRSNRYLSSFGISSLSIDEEGWVI